MVHFQSNVEPDHRTASDVTLERLALEQLDEIEPLWTDLVDHHTALPPAVTFREASDSWPRMRELYHEILGDGGVCLVARRNGRAVGYAVVKFEGPEQVWKTGKRLAELETLSVVEDERGGGVGTLLMDEVERELAARGVDDLIIGVEGPNDGGRRFYERRGYRFAFTWLYGKPATLRTERETGAGEDP